MAQNWILVLLILLFRQKMSLAEVQRVSPPEGKEVEFKCSPEAVNPSIVLWFRVTDESGMQFIVSHSYTAIIKKHLDNFSSLYKNPKIINKEYILTLRSFDKARDSGMYSCAALHRGNELIFGAVTQLSVAEKKVQVTKPAPAKESMTVQTTPKSPKPPKTQVCKPQAAENGLFCAPVILGPLAGGCGLLLLLLIITTLYCNKIRTRRCPHHYKRKPRMVPDKQVMVNRHI